MKRKISLALVFVLVCGLFLAACGSPGGSSAPNESAPSSAPAESVAGEDGGTAQIVLSAGETNAQDHAMTQCLYKLSELVSEKSGGRIRIDVYPAAQLGDERTQMQAVQMGGLDIFRVPGISLGDFGADKMNVMALPYLFVNRDHLWGYLTSDHGRELLANVQESGTGMVGLSYVEEGARHFFVNYGEVTSVSDLAGKKIRVAETSILMDTVSSFGASPTPISYGELYTSLQTGVVDGADQPLIGYRSNNFFEVANYMVMDGHSYAPSVIVISELTWNSLGEEDRRIILEAALEVEDYNRQLAQEEDDRALKEILENGAVVTEPDDITEWQAAVQPVYDKYAAGYEDIVEAIRSYQ